MARQLKGGGIQTLGELVAFCNQRGGSWWRSIPRIGPGRTHAIVSWLRKQQASLRLTIEADVDPIERKGVPLIAAELVEVGQPPRGREAARTAAVQTATQPVARAAGQARQVDSRWRRSSGSPCRTRCPAPRAENRATAFSYI